MSSPVKRQSPMKKAEGLFSALMPKGTCTAYSWPFIIYGVLALLSIIMVIVGPSTREMPDGTVVSIDKPKVVIQSTIVSLLWLYLIAYLSVKCRNKWAWFVLFLPLVMLIGLVVLAMILGFSLTSRI